MRVRVGRPGTTRAARWRRSASRRATAARGPLKARCTRSARRLLTPRCRDAYAALTAARARERTAGFTAIYHRRAGIEGTISQGVRAMHLRQARYIGLAKTRLQHVLTAAALNFVRLGAWLDDVPLARTRPSAYLRLMTAPTAT